MDSSTVRSASCIVLVVDDQDWNRKLVDAALRGDGEYTIVHACDGVEAQEILQRQPIDVVVADVMMPRMDGLALLAWAQTHWVDDSGPIWIIHSALDTFGAAVQALQHGAFDFVAKPLGSVRLIQASVRNAAAQRRLLTERAQLHQALAESNRALSANVTELQTACTLLREQADTIQKDLDRAELIQRALLPRAAPAMPGFAVDTVYRPSRNIGGDGYDIVRLDERHVAFYVADVAGHGVAAAMLSVLLKHRLAMRDPVSQAPLSPAVVLGNLNRALRGECAAPGLFVTIVYGVLDLQTHELVVASAGHPPLALHRADGEVTMVERTGPALGLEDEAEFAERALTLDAGAQLLVYTDGLCDALAQGVAMSCDAIARAMATDSDGGQHLLHALLDASAAQHAGNVLDDDVTLLLLTATCAAADALSTLDHGTQCAHRDDSSPAVTDSQVAALAVGETDGTTWLTVRGRGRWVEATACHRVGAAALRAGRDLVIDLSACVYLDSTFLGTVHELVALGGDDAVRIQGLGDEVRLLFEELAMHRVLAHVTDDTSKLRPKMRPVAEATGTRDPAEVRARILHAHELLTQLSEHNREQFQGVVDAMRSDGNR